MGHRDKGLRYYRHPYTKVPRSIKDGDLYVIKPGLDPRKAFIIGLHNNLALLDSGIRAGDCFCPGINLVYTLNESRGSCGVLASEKFRKERTVRHYRLQWPQSFSQALGLIGEQVYIDPGSSQFLLDILWQETALSENRHHVSQCDTALRAFLSGLIKHLYGCVCLRK